jgi:MFS family permease
MNIDENLLPLEESRKTRMSNLKREATFVQDPKASFYFAIYAFNQFVIGTMISAFTPIQESLTLAYQVNKQSVIMSSSVFLVGNVLSSLFVYPVCVKIGLTWTIRCALIAAFAGCLLRLLIGEGFFFVLLGQTLLGVSAGFQLNTTMQFCYNWFSPSRRPIYMSIVSVSNIFGGGLGALLPLLFVNSKERQVDAIKHQVMNYIFTFTILFLVLAVINLLFFKGQPEGNFGAQEDDDEEEDELP